MSALIHAGFVAGIVAAIIGGAVLGNGHPMDRGPHVLGIVVSTIDCPRGTADPRDLSCKALYAIDIDHAGLDEPGRERHELPKNALRIGTLPRNTVSIAFGPDGRTVRFLTWPADTASSDTPSQLDLWSADIGGLAPTLVREDYVEDDPFGEPLPVLLGQSPSIRVRQVLFGGTEHTSGGALSPDGELVAYARLGLDSQSICLKAPAEALDRGEGICFGDGAFGTPAWLPWPGS